MSGPKSSRYTLTPEQRRVLAAQQKLSRERAALSLSMAALNEHLAFVSRHEKRLQGVQLPETRELCLLAQEMLSRETPSGLAGLQELASQTEETARQAANAAAVFANLRRELEARVEQSISTDIHKGFSATLDEALAAREPTAADCEARLQPLLAAPSRASREKVRQALAQLTGIASPQLLQSFITLTVQPLERQVRQEEALYASEEAAFTRLTLRYAALSAELGLQTDAPEWTPGAAAQLEQRIAALEATLMQQAEERYIRQALDEAMAEMGYTLLGERDVRKRSGARFHHALYTTGDGTAIDVTYDANGQIALELGGLDNTDRIPDTDESTVLCGSMEDFCVTFEAFEERLARKGVVLRERIAMLPPSEEHAQIINVDDYQLTGDAPLLDVQHDVKGVRHVHHRHIGED